MLEMQLAEMENEASTFTAHWRDLGDYILPRRTRFYASDRNKGDKRNSKIIDSTATLAARTLQSGMMAGITSPARPWFRLTTPDPDMSEYGPVKQWLHVVSQRMSTVFLKSNLYNILPILYADIGIFGTAAAGAYDDDLTALRFYSFPIGSFYLANDARMRVAVFARRFQLTVRQIVETFGQRNTNNIDWSNISTTVKTLWDRGSNDWIDVIHIVTPNDRWDFSTDYGDGMVPVEKKRWLSYYYEPGGTDQDIFLRKSGFDEFPILAPRWDVVGEDVFGTNCPGMTCLGDIRQLQLMEKRGAEALDKLVRPPMVGPSSLRNSKASILPGDITYLDVREGQQGFRPVYQVPQHLDQLEAKAQQIRQRISKAFYEDLFLMLALSDRRQMTATEVAERHEEKLLMLGPVLERMNDELLDPLIDRTYKAMERRGYIPSAPEELQGLDLKVEYISIMAQAQKLVGLAGLERFSGYVGNLLRAFPEVRHKIDILQAVDEYGEMIGVPPRVVRGDDETTARIQAEQQAIAQQQQMAAMQQAAADAKTLSETDTHGDNALSDFLAMTNAMPGAVAS